MDRFAAMKTFVRVAELGTLSAAARELGSDAAGGQSADRGAGTASRRTAVPPFDAPARADRRRRNLLPVTRAKYCGRWMRRKRAPANCLLHCVGICGCMDLSGLARLHLSPIVIEFQRLHPEVNIELILDDRVADLIAEGVDVADPFR